MREIERVAFFGSPDFALPTLEALHASRYRPRLVISQPARRAGRGRHLEDPPVARWALERGVELRQPERVRATSFLESFGEWRADLAVVVAFGQIFPQALLDLPRVGCINLHGSLLPRYRGAAPVQAAIAAGETETGVTTMLMDAGMDTGPILLQRCCAIARNETSPELATRLAELGGPLVVETIRGLEKGTLQPVPQDDAQATYAPRLKKQDGHVDWSSTATELARRSRAYRPWPGLTALCAGRELKLLEVKVLEGSVDTDAKPGLFLGLVDDALAVACGGSSILGLVRVQRAGKRPLDSRQFLSGERLEAGRREFSNPPRQD